MAGISLGKRRFFPEKTLVSSNKFSCDTLENREILSFIYTLLLHSEQRRQEVEVTLSNSLTNFTVNGIVKNEYILSSSVIQQYTKMAFTEYLTYYDKIIYQLSDIFSQYQQAIPCAYSLLRHPPSPSPVFLEVHHYRKVFELINTWFGKSDFRFPTKNPLLHFASADDIYEYYCLLNLYDILIALGFEEQTEKRNLYKYAVRRAEYFRNTDVDNTFYFQKGDCLITLFFQPVIYSYIASTTNGIELFRTDSSYYTPDFIIKKQDNTGTKYGILDAKWRNRKTLEKLNSGGKYDMVYKYVYSILDTNSLQPVPFFWLMQGKDDSKYVPTYYHRKSEISKKFSAEFQNSTGIVRVTPKSGTSEIMKILQVFLA